MKKEILAIAVVALVVASFGAGYLEGAGNQRTVTSVSTIVSSTTKTVTVEADVPNGMSLTLSTNATVIHLGDRLAITANLHNDLNQTNEISVGYHWPFLGILMFNQNWPPCGIFSPLELVVLKGNYSTSEIVGMGPGSSPSYLCMEDTEYFSFSFAPSSSQSLVTGRYSESTSNETIGPYNTSLTVATNGYWILNGSQPTYPTSYSGLGNYNFLPAPQSFAPGIYTVAVADEWGQLAIMHLTVE